MSVSRQDAVVQLDEVRRKVADAPRRAAHPLSSRKSFLPEGVTCSPHLNLGKNGSPRLITDFLKLTRESRRERGEEFVDSPAQAGPAPPSCLHGTIICILSIID